MADGRRHIMIGTPCFGGNVTHLYTLSLLRLQRAAEARDVALSYRLLRGDALITRARNLIVGEFLADPTATHLLFIDADLGFDAAQVFRLLDAAKDVAAAIYPLKHLDWTAIRQARTSTPGEFPANALAYAVEFLDPANIIPVDGFAAARYAGNGFMMIARPVFERMAACYPELLFRRSDIVSNIEPREHGLYGFFDTMIDPETRHYLSEDYAFCRRWRQAGGELWVDLTSKLTHIGAVDFPGDLMSVFQPVRN